nr:OmpA family protein [Methylonatrum kenyense]
MALEAELADEEERTRLAQREIEDRETRVRDLQALTEEQRRALEEEQELSEAQIARIDRLNRQVTALREQLRRVAGALELSQEEVAERDVRIEELGRELNLALVDEVRELSRYRSEFFGRLREILGDRDDIQIVGDRFRFQSELFFDTAEAEIGEEGRSQLDDVARTMLEIAEEIDDNDIPWILQVEGHTDRRQIRTAEFPSNWQLSTARAQSIVDYLIDRGVPPERLSATGFAEFHPVDEGDDAEALSRNRRIEMRITSR